jgi:hypothetical protein
MRSPEGGWGEWHDIWVVIAPVDGIDQPPLSYLLALLIREDVQ